MQTAAEEGLLLKNKKKSTLYESTHILYQLFIVYPIL